MKKVSALIVSCLLIGGCAHASSEPTPAPAPVRISNSGQAPAPQSGAMTRTTVHESSRTVVQVLRLAPNAVIAEHRHPVFDENMIVEQGSVTAVLNGTTYELHAGDIVVIPAGTTIRGRNTGNQEARIVVVFSSTGQAGPLSVPVPSHP
jgi:quercetin dioxygenase-like cupin family protein